MSDYVLKIEKLENGYEVEFCDADVQAANRKPKAQWKDPWKSYVFLDVAAVSKFVSEKLDKLKPLNESDEYNDAFKTAVAEGD